MILHQYIIICDRCWSTKTQLMHHIRGNIIPLPALPENIAGKDLCENCYLDALPKVREVLK